MSVAENLFNQNAFLKGQYGFCPPILKVFYARIYYSLCRVNNTLFEKGALVHNVWSWKVDQYYDFVSSLGLLNV